MHTRGALQVAYFGEADQALSYFSMAGLLTCSPDYNPADYMSEWWARVWNLQPGFARVTSLCEGVRMTVCIVQ